MKKSSYAIASLILGILSFIQLLGLEKAIVAGVFGVLALKEVKTGEVKDKNFAYIGIALGTIYIITVAVLFATKGSEVISYLKK